MTVSTRTYTVVNAGSEIFRVEQTRRSREISPGYCPRVIYDPVDPLTHGASVRVLFASYIGLIFEFKCLTLRKHQIRDGTKTSVDTPFVVVPAGAHRTRVQTFRMYLF